jgi:hypothetical protein
MSYCPTLFTDDTFLSNIIKFLPAANFVYHRIIMHRGTRPNLVFPKDIVEDRINGGYKVQKSRPGVTHVTTYFAAVVDGRCLGF